MLYYYFKLDDYFNTTQRYFYFLDGVFRSCDRGKKEVLDELKIPDSTYRTNRLKPKARNSWTYMPIVEYFGYNMLDSTKQKQYEKCLAKIFHNIYFKNTESLKKLKVELEEYINENNYLKPIFILFRVLVTYALIDRYSEQKRVVEEDLEYLDYFKKNYFTEDLQFLLLIIKYFFGKKVNLVEIENYAHRCKGIVWFYYYLSGTINYLNKNDREALSYYELVLDIFLKDFNIDRYASMINNISFIYNYSGKYALGLEKSSQLVNYAVSDSNVSNNVKYCIKHYLFSAFMLNKYEDICEFFDEIEDDSYLGDIYIVIAYFTHKIVYGKESILPNNIINRISKSDNLQEVVKMINNKKLDVDCLIKMFNLPYWSKIIEKMQVDISKIK